MQSSVRRGGKDDLSAGKRRKVRSWRCAVPPFLKRNQTLRQMDLVRALAGDKKWEYSDRKEKSALINAMGYPAKVYA